MSKIYDVVYTIVFRVEAENPDEAFDTANELDLSQAIEMHFDNVKEVK
jgi:hypothetical protein